MIPAIILGILATVLAIRAVEKKRVDGVLTYPLWTGNLFYFWASFTLIFAVLIGCITLPRFVGIALHPMMAQGTVTAITIDGHCHVDYSFIVGGVSHTGTDGLCGIKVGDPHSVYYNGSAPENSTLYTPGDAFEGTLAATMLISLSVAAMAVIWFRLTHIIGKRKFS